MSVICTIFAASEYDPLEYDAGRGGDEVAFLSVRRKFPLLELGAHFFGYIPRLPRGGGVPIRRSMPRARVPELAIIVLAAWLTPAFADQYDDAISKAFP